MINIKKYWTSLVKRFKNYLNKKSSKQAYPTEPEIVEKEIHHVIEKIERSWNHFLYAQADYIEIAVMEIYCFELEYGILYNKLRQLYGEKRKIRYPNSNTRDYLPWLQRGNAARSDKLVDYS